MVCAKYFQLVTIAIIFFSGPLTASVQGQKVITELNRDELIQLEQRKHILRKRAVKESSWPELTIYTLIDASPLESVAIFAAYDYQKKYIPNLIKSEPHHVTATEVNVDYEMKMPWPLSNGEYTHGHYLKNLSPVEYEVEWFMIKSNSTQLVKGRAQFFVYKGKTLFKYVSLVDPKSVFAGIFKKLMVRDVLKSIDAIIETTEKIRLEHPDLLDKYKNHITSALKGVKVYQ